MVSNNLAHGRHALCLNEMERSQSKGYIWQRSVSALAVAEYWVGREDGYGGGGSFNRCDSLAAGGGPSWNDALLLDLTMESTDPSSTLRILDEQQSLSYFIHVDRARSR